MEDYSRLVPFTLKSELIEDQRLHPPFGSNLTFPISAYSRFSQTSGTSGKPMRWLDTQESWDWMLGNWQQVFRSAGVDSDDCVFIAFSFGPFLGFWTAFEAACKMGCLCIPGGGMRSGARLNVMIDSSATVLCCTPTYAIHLAEIAVEENIDLSQAKIRKLIVAGEPGGSIPATRKLIEQLWNGAQVVDHHGMTEIGPVTYGCPVCPNVLHVIESGFYAEVIDRQEDGRGELVLTNLGRHGSPLLRYRTGDLVQAEEGNICECGTTDMALVGGILGRTDDMVVVRGVNVYPGAVEEIVRSCGDVAEFRVSIHQQMGLVEMALEVEPVQATSNNSGFAHRVETALRDALALRIPVRVVPHGTLPRFELKARRWIRS